MWMNQDEDSERSAMMSNTPIGSSVFILSLLKKTNGSVGYNTEREHDRESLPLDAQGQQYSPGFGEGRLGSLLPHPPPGISSM